MSRDVRDGAVSGKRARSLCPPATSKPACVIAASILVLPTERRCLEIHVCLQGTAGLLGCPQGLRACFGLRGCFLGRTSGCGHVVVASPCRCLLRRFWSGRP